MRGRRAAEAFPAQKGSPNPFVPGWGFVRTLVLVRWDWGRCLQYSSHTFVSEV